MIVADARFDRVAEVRSTLATGLAPVYWLGNAPSQFHNWFSGLFVSKDDLQQENEDLKARLLILERRALKYAALASENNELRRLMNSSDVLDDRVIVGEVVGVSPDPFSHEIVINKGSSDGVKPGQAILDAHGLMGQVIQTSQVTSRVLLVSDSSHAVPVEVVRNGLRAILLGTGDPNTLDLVHVPDTADIREGDLLVSSGLGGRFPRGYPVAEVASISQEPGEPFVSIKATPKAELNQSRLVLVVFPPESDNHTEPASDGAATGEAG
ncbi:rod shape-determining protein MreC [Marinobacter santoriniensis NKSG1]|uniref:Cell shape-determining protein MreC n=1 Tax=Marinobacter santoriniensis NKSG1 TaxID=1288826 RepID=M7D5L8_9GAMM|nr:rod shape-determining protein MreC [Marinobacter santoriniensis NKSG1]